MAVASIASLSTSPPITSTLFVAVVDFLKSASDICCTAWDLHHRDASQHCPAKVYSDQVGSVGHASRCLLAERQNAVAAAPPEGNDGFRILDACCIVSRNLTLRLARVEASAAFVEEAHNVINLQPFISVWVVHEVQALGVRLNDLIQQLEDLDPSSTLHHLGEHRRRLKNIVAAQAAAPALYVAKPLPDVKKISDDGLKGLHVKSIPKANTAPAPNAILNEFILDSLTYKSMHDREEEVTKAHGSTLEWLFPSDDTLNQAGSHQGDLASKLSRQFGTWLTTNELGPIFWITGKPGSGKSTFMRFLSEHPQTQSRLESWARETKVITANFFFWTSGSREQRSLTGLLRYLLHQLLNTHQEFTGAAFPALLQKLSGMTTKERIQLTLDWTVSELHEAFRGLMDAMLQEYKICFFIDGMDEFEGDHNAIIDFFQKLSMRQGGGGVKLCLSSRPWKVFEEAFETKVPNMRLQDVTYGDMEMYVVDRLNGDKHMKAHIRKEKLDATIVAKEVIERADGVFLWARLGVNELFKRLSKGDKFGPLALLATLPSDLYHLFDKVIFHDQTEKEIADSSTLFQLMRAREIVADFVKGESSNSLTVWEIKMALTKDSVPRDVSAVPDKDIVKMCKETVVFVQERFSGLLELHEKRDRGHVHYSFEAGTSEADFFRRIADSRATYIHRTVRDWLMYEPGIQGRFQEYSPPNFDPNLQLLRSYILRMKHPLEEPERRRWFDDLWPDVALAMTHARYIASDPTELQRTLINELEKTVSWYWPRKTRDPYDHWARNAFGAYEMRMKSAPIWQPFLCLAVKFGLTVYVEAELIARREQPDPDGLADTEAVPLLAYATEFLCSSNKTAYPLSDPCMVEMLLRHQQNLVNPGVNHVYTEFGTRKPRTVWISVLRHLRDAKRRAWIDWYDIDPQGVERWVRVVRTLVQVGGPKVDAVVEKDAWDPEITAKGVMELLDDRFADERIQGLKQLLEDEGKLHKGEENEIPIR